MLDIGWEDFEDQPHGSIKSSYCKHTKIAFVPINKTSQTQILLVGACKATGVGFKTDDIPSHSGSKSHDSSDVTDGWREMESLHCFTEGRLGNKKKTKKNIPVQYRVASFIRSKWLWLWSGRCFWDDTARPVSSIIRPHHWVLTQRPSLVCVIYSPPTLCLFLVLELASMFLSSMVPRIYL